MTKLEKLLTELEELDKEKTPGEWVPGKCLENDGTYRLSGIKYDNDQKTNLDALVGLIPRRSDARFMAKVSNALPQLIKVIRIQTELLNKMINLKSRWDNYGSFYKPSDVDPLLKSARQALEQIEDLLK